VHRDAEKDALGSDPPGRKYIPETWERDSRRASRRNNVQGDSRDSSIFLKPPCTTMVRCLMNRAE